MISSHTIPDTWEWATLGTICDTVNGGTPKRARPDYFGGDVPWVKSGELNDSTVSSSEEYLTEEGLLSSSARMLESGTLLIALYGATVGKLGILGMPASTNQAVCAITPRHEGIDTKFLFYYLLSKRQKLRSSSFGAAQGNISQAIIRDLEIPVAPALEQKRIVARIDEVFSELDAGVGALEQVNQQMDVYRRSLLASAFAGNLTSDWRRGNLAATPCPDTGEERPRGIPENWAWLTIQSVTRPSTERYNPKKSESRMYLGLEHIESGTGQILDTGDSSSVTSLKSVFKAGDVLYGRLRPYLNKVAVPRFDGVCSTDILVFPKSQYYDSGYLSFVLLSPKFVEFASTRMTGVQHPRIQFATMSKYSFPFPPVAEQRVIVGRLEHTLSVMRKVREEIESNQAKSESLRSSILQIAFVGKLVHQNPDEEPAKQLLEKISAKKTRF